MTASIGQIAFAGHRGIPRRLLKTKEAAYYLGISTWKVRKLVLDRKLPCVIDSANSPWLFDIRDLDAYIETNKHMM
jgi:excisionase family DNA binding protein